MSRADRTDGNRDDLARLIELVVTRHVWGRDLTEEQMQDTLASALDEGRRHLIKVRAVEDGRLAIEFAPELGDVGRAFIEASKSAPGIDQVSLREDRRYSEGSRRPLGSYVRQVQRFRVIQRRPMIAEAGDKSDVSAVWMSFWQEPCATWAVRKQCSNSGGNSHENSVTG